MDYDVLILGGGMFGCSIAYELSKYSLNIAVIEKEYDIGTDIELINSSIIYDGVEAQNNLMSTLEVMGNSMIRKITSKFNVPFKDRSTLTIATNKEEEKIIEGIYKTAVDRGINDIFFIGKEDVEKLQPDLKVNVTKAIYSRKTGVTCPYDLAIAYGEVAFDNGVNFRFSEKVLNIEKIANGFRITTNKNKFTCKKVINTIPDKNYNIDENLREEEYQTERKNLNYFLVEGDSSFDSSNIIVKIKDKDEKIISVPTFEGNLIGEIITSKDISSDENIEKVKNINKEIKDENISSFYRHCFYNDALLIDDSLIDKGYIKISGKNYAEVTITPAISRIVCETIVSNIKCKLKKNFNDKRREFYRFRDLSNEERERLIKLDKRYGKMICVCKKVTEGEIIDAITRPLGARTVEGIKRRTGAMLGNCKGAGCIDKVVSILARETNKKITDIVKDSMNSNIVVGRIKEFNEV